MRRLPKHGGDIAWASAEFSLAAEAWLDLSTGISPWPWPVEHWPQQVFRTLPPQSLQSLQQVAAHYYGCASDAVVPVPGSQYAISLLPTLMAPSAVAIPEVGYQEHREAWQRAGHCLYYYRDFTELSRWIEQGVVVNAVVINPNNPSGMRLTQDELGLIQQALRNSTGEQGLLLVDEAFMDVAPEHSLATTSHADTLVLRSFGKFFGLAGVRLGFVLDPGGRWRERLRRQAGPWLLSHPAVWVAQQAMADTAWTERQRARISASSLQLLALLNEYLSRQSWPCQCRNSGLFITLTAAPAPLYRLFLQLAQQGILTRYGQIDGDRAWLRFGLAASYQRLQAALLPDNSSSGNC